MAEFYPSRADRMARQPCNPPAVTFGNTRSRRRRRVLHRSIEKR